MPMNNDWVHIRDHKRIVAEARAELSASDEIDRLRGLLDSRHRDHAKDREADALEIKAAHAEIARLTVEAVTTAKALAVARAEIERLEAVLTDPPADAKPKRSKS